MTYNRLKRWVRRRWAARGPWIKANLAACLVALVNLVLFTGYLGERLEPLLLDAWFSVRGAIAPPADVVVISLNQEGYEALNQPLIRPIPRRFTAQLLRELAQFKPRLVVVDTLYHDAGDPVEDNAFAAALGASPTYIGRFVQEVEQTDAAGQPHTIRSEITPLPIFLAHAKGTFLTNVPIDYGVARRFKIDLRDGRATTPMAIAAAPGAPLPQPGDFLNYYGASGHLPTVPYQQLILHPESLPIETFRDKVVVIGQMLAVTSNALTRDAFAVPHSRAPLYGVEIHATAAGNIIRNDWVRRNPRRIEALFLTLTAFLLTLAIVRMSPPRGALVLIAAVLLWAAGSYCAFLHGYFVPGLLLAAISLPLIFAISSFFYYLALRRTHEDMERALGVKLHVKR